jgi:hypothetical protein
MNFGEILLKAWKIVWKHKVLWIFGILAGCGQATGSNGSNFSYQFSNNNYGSGLIPQNIQDFFNYYNRLSEGQVSAIVIGTILVILLLVIITTFLGTIGRIGLIRGTRQADQGVEKLIIGDLFSSSFPYFWRIFLLNLLIGIAIIVLILLLVMPIILLTKATNWISLICLLPLVCVSVPFSWFVGLIIQQASIAIVIENIPILQGLRRCWELVKSNFSALALMALILYMGVNLIGGFIIGIPVMAAVVPAIMGIVSNTGSRATSGLVTGAICFIAYLPILLLLSGTLRAYVDSAWTLTYLRLTQKPASVETISPAL